jgi:uncharacterized membrane protein YbhN (UPF0104 family)
VRCILKNKIFKYVGLLITLAAFVFIGKSLFSMHIDMKYLKNPIFLIVLGLLLSIGYAILVYISSFAWKMTLSFIHKGKISFQEIISVYVKANIGKYLPGNVMHFAGRNILAGKLGFKQLDIAFCSIVEIVMLIFTACFLSIILAMQSFQMVIKNLYGKINPFYVFGILIILFIFIAVAIWLFIKKSGFIDKYKHLFTRNFLKLLCKLFCIYSVTLIIPGIFLVLIFTFALGCNLSLQTTMIIIAAYTISWVAGFIVPGAPGGIGVRESILLLILSPFYANDIILLAAILHRISSILGDIIAFVIEPIILKHWATKNQLIQ